MTESCGCITTHPLDKHSFLYTGTGGTLVANFLVKVVNSQGKKVGIDGKGEVSLKKRQDIFCSHTTIDPSQRAPNGAGLLQQCKSHRGGF
jgi:hypothetical protein